MRQLIYQGGLMRCCLETLRIYIELNPEPEDGKILDCMFETPGNQQMICEFKDGGPEVVAHWRWRDE